MRRSRGKARGDGQGEQATSGAYREYYEGLIGKGMRAELAHLSVARKLAAAVLAVWKSGGVFDERRIMKAAA
jgi:hypothetical protein